VIFPTTSPGALEAAAVSLAVSGADPAAASFATPAAARTEPAAAEAINVRRETVTTVPSDPSGEGGVNVYDNAHFSVAGSLKTSFNLPLQHN
jgi:hypothetical protein